MRCQHLFCSASLRSNIRPDGDNFIVKIGYYDKYGLVVNDYSNTLMELKYVIRFINKQILYNIVVFHYFKKKIVLKENTMI